MHVYSSHAYASGALRSYRERDSMTGHVLFCCWRRRGGGGGDFCVESIANVTTMAVHRTKQDAHQPNGRRRLRILPPSISLCLSSQRRRLPPPAIDGRTYTYPQTDAHAVGWMDRRRMDGRR